MSYRMVGLIYCLFVILVFIPNMIYAFWMAKRGVSSALLLFGDMLLKLCQIPIYFLVFLVAVGLLVHGIGIILMPIFIVFDYALLLATSMYGVSGLIKARREGKITTKAAIINGILHFFFCADTVSAVVVFIMVKNRDRTLLRENSDECKRYRQIICKT